MTTLLNLYSTSHCHLCEQAEELIHSIKNKYEVLFTIIDIANDNNLQAIYDIKIPVLQRVDNHQEICWPFSIDDVKKLILQ